MAAQHAKRRRGKQNSTESSTGQYLIIGVAVLVVGLVLFGAAQMLGLTFTTQPNAASVTDSVAAVDRETRYLGPASDPATVSLAEAGQLGQPTLVWFHADWCHVCQQVKPEVVNLGEAFDGKIKIVRLNVDYAENKPALQRYGVRATPTFVLIDAKGQVRGNVPGWPGYEAFFGAFDQLIAGG